MYCFSCGKQLPNAASFCPSCGKQLPPTIEPSPAIADLRLDKQRLTTEPESTTIYPLGDIEPLFHYEKSNWIFLRKADSSPILDWLRKPFDIMVSTEYVFILSNDSAVNWKSIAGNAMLVSGAVVSSAVPFVGLPLALSAMAVGTVLERKTKHPGYGKNGQFKRDELFQAIHAGRCLWSKKKACELTAYSYRQLLFDVYHCSSIVGCFNLTSQAVDIVAFQNHGYNGLLGAYGSNFKKDLVEEGECTLSHDIKVRTEAEALAVIRNKYSDRIK